MNPFDESDSGLRISTKLGDKLYFIFKEDQTNGNMIIVDVLTINGNYKYTQTSPPPNPSSPAERKTMFTIIPLMWGLATFRVVNAGPFDDNTDWDKVPDGSKWTFDIMVTGALNAQTPEFACALA